VVRAVAFRNLVYTSDVLSFKCNSFEDFTRTLKVNCRMLDEFP